MPDQPPDKFHRHPSKVIVGQSYVARPACADPQSGLRNDPLQSKIHDPKPRIAYAELHCLSNFSFLRGASHPEELVERAAELGYQALAITDRNSLAGVVRAHAAAKHHNREHPDRPLRLMIGAEITPIDAPPIVLLATDRASYGRLCRLITRGRLRAVKGDCRITLTDVAEFAEGLIAIVDSEGFAEPRDAPTMIEQRSGAAYRSIFLRGSLYLAAALTHDEPDESRLTRLVALARHAGVPLVATNRVHYHDPRRRYLQDVLTCIREKCTLASAGSRLLPNADRHLRPLDEIERRYAAPADAAVRREAHKAIARSAEIATRCTFSLDELKYEYPHELAPAGRTPMEYLEELTWTNAAERYETVPPDVRRLLESELSLIREVRYEHYFLTVHDLVTFARSRGILCQGRGSAANSAVCYCLGITAVDPARHDLLFERFISRERNEPPDIDVDFEHERREEVFQYIYQKYGRDRAAITAEVITYRPRSAVRDVGKALGLSLDRVDAVAKSIDWFSRDPVPAEALRNAGLDPADRTVQMLLRLVQQLLGFPRHLSQHVGGFVITESPLCEIVPLENGAMPDRTFIQWDKDDIDELGILKVDCLALGMLTAINKCFTTLGKGFRDSGIQGLRMDAAYCSHRLAKQPTWGPLNHGATRSVRGNGCYGDQGDAHELTDDLSRFDGVEKSDHAGENDLSSYEHNAGFGTLRARQSDASGSSVDPQQHCRRQRPREQKTVHPPFDDRARLVGGIGNPTCTRRRIGFPQELGEHQDSHGGGLAHASGPHRELAPETGEASGRLLIPQSLNPLIPLSLTEIPPEDPAVYDMICRADTVGVFQIESRAQMSMLPRLRPRNFYDLVIEVAIVRPGPIQGGMVHPYLKRRHGLEPVTYPSPAVRQVLEKTLGVPLFQEQVMRLAVVAAGFTPGEADQLRRAMGAWRRNGEMQKFQTKLMAGLLANGYKKEFAESLYKQIAGFGEYGFPESHSASFSLLVYASAWLKRYHPAAFCAALLNSQPMGFYTPSQLIQDVARHGVRVLPVDVNASEWDCTLEYDEGSTAEGDRGACPKGIEGSRSQHDGLRQQGDGPEPLVRESFLAPDSAGIPSGSSIHDLPHSIIQNPKSKIAPALRLGFRLVRGLSAERVAGIEASRRSAPIRCVRTLARHPDVSRDTFLRLAAADAFRSLGLNRRAALWAILALDDDPPPLFQDAAPNDETVALPPEPLDETLLHDYDATGLSLNAHPIELVRNELSTLKVARSDALAKAPRGRRISVAGLVTCRQHPSTAKGTVFLTLEDEAGNSNLIVRPNVWERYGPVGRAKSALIADGVVERQGEVVHVMVTRLRDLSANLIAVRTKSRDFR